MKLRNPWIIRVVGWLGALVIRCWMRTVRYRFWFAGQQIHPGDRGLRERFIYAFWHESMLFPAVARARRKLYVLISQHADGELIAQICRHLGFEVVRGSTTRGGVPALRGLLQQSRGGHLAVTPDGPRGPRRRVQPGIIYLASRTGLPLVPAGIGFSKAWRARSWDEFAVPWPGSMATCVVAPVLRVPPNLDREGIEHYRCLLETRMNEATIAAEKQAQHPWSPRSGVGNLKVGP